MTRYLALAAMAFLTACSTVTTGTKQAVFITTPEMSGAFCALKDSKKGVWELQSAPGSVMVRKGNGPMEIVCRKDGYETATLLVADETAGATFGNILLGGGIGVIVDAASGAAQKYPDEITIWMKPTSFVTDAARQDWEAKKAAWEKKVQEELEARKKMEESRATNK